MFFDPKTNFVDGERPQQRQMQMQMPRPQMNQNIIRPTQQVQQQQIQNQQQNAGAQQQGGHQVLGSNQQVNSQGPELNERILRMRQEQMMEEQEDYSIIQKRIDSILEKDPKKIEQSKELEYLEKLKKNPFIKQKFTNSMDQENMRIMILFNTKQNFDYKLKHYMYFTNQPNLNFDLKYYNKYHIEKKETNLKFYLKFSDKEPDYVLVRRSQILKNYGQLSNNFIDNETLNIIQTKPYRGFYSNQYDYQFFKMQMSSEKINFTD